LLSLLVPPEPLTPFQRRLVWIVALLVAVTRVFALSKTLWDWDEAQFASGVRDVEVGAYHHPHPPGFPVYIGLAKLARLFAPTDFHALQTVVLLAACALFPLGFLLTRELRFRFSTAVLGPLLFCFLPNVWFFGGTAFSDIPGVAFALAAAMMLLRGCRSPRAYLAGALLLGLASGMRPQAVVLGAAPLGVATWIHIRQSWRRVAAAAAISAGTVLIAYSCVALASDGFGPYLASVRGVGDWVRQYDAWMAPGREPLRNLLDEFFLRPMGAGRLGIVVSCLAVVGALRGLLRDGSKVGLALLTFFPFAFFAYLSLDVNSIHRYSVAYLFLWALLAAHALAPLWKWPAAAQVIVLLLMVGRYAQWGGVMLTEVRDSDSPSYAVSMWLRERVPPGQRVWIHGSLAPFAEYYLADRDFRFPRDRGEVLAEGRSGEFYAEEGTGAAPGALTFVRPQARIWDVARRRYFATSVAPVERIWYFGEGWWDPEYIDGGGTWRWMGNRGEIGVPRGEGRARLSLTFEAQTVVPVTLDVVLNGRLLERFPVPAAGPVAKEWIVQSRADAPNALSIRSSASLNPKRDGLSEDARDLSVRLIGYDWQPVR